MAAEKKSTTHIARPRQPLAALIPMATSVRHVHLTQETVERLFGAGYLLNVRSPLSQGCDAPVRESGDLTDSPGIVIEGPAGRMTLQHGVIRAARHIHMSPADADVLGLKEHDKVSVAVVAGNRRLIFGDIVVRVSPAYRMELHLDSDEGNATGLRSGDDVLLAEIDTGAGAR